ncbi:hypothetical protein [Streptomyces sp. NPDC057718]|uniref:hypothetical protein n=1 Tax=Streptomyces sp. NPDC057718 TaxID=3346225 RepID=UPI00367D84B5
MTGRSDRPHAEREPRGATVERAVGIHSVPAATRALSSLSRIDYADVFTLSEDVLPGNVPSGDVGTNATAEQWARALFGDVPSPTERLIWQGLLGLRLSRGRSPDTVAGWRITGRGEDWIRLEAASWFLTNNLVVRAAAGRVSLGTFLRYDRPPARAVWSPLSAVHRRLAPGLLRDAAAAVRGA